MEPTIMTAKQAKELQQNSKELLNIIFDQIIKHSIDGYCELTLTKDNCEKHEHLMNNIEAYERILTSLQYRVNCTQSAFFISW